MLFNSLAFAIFLPVVFAGYWGVKGHLRLQNLLVLVASYVFYGWWDWRFLALIAFSSGVDYVVGLALGRTDGRRERRALLGVSLTANLGLLGLFKYFNFFAAEFADLLSLVGLHASAVTLGLVLPVGISFYTFQTLSYTIDVYHRKLDPCRDPVVFFAYVSFFPQLVAGPIERASHLLPQFERPRTFDERAAVDGLRQMLWGLFKKVAVADTCGVIVDRIFDGYQGFSSVTLAIGVFLFAIQIYGDFSGYSDVAIGTARLFGIDLMRNFANPYFSRDIAEFWRRWHISLSTWFRDYVYFPLGGSRTDRWRALRNIVVVFVVSGFWHGANWTFIVWGALNGLYFLPLFLSNRNRRYLDVVAEGRVFPSLQEAAQISITFALVLIAWVFFRAPTVSVAFGYLTRMFTVSPFGPLRVSVTAALMALTLLGAEWIQRARPHGLDVAHWHPWARSAAYLVLIALVIQFSDVRRQFIYFQF